MPKILIGPHTNGLVFPQEVLKEIFDVYGPDSKIWNIYSKTSFQEYVPLTFTDPLTIDNVVYQLKDRHSVFVDGTYNTVEELQLRLERGSILRVDPFVHRLCEKYTKKFDAIYSRWKVVDVPDDVDWIIYEGENGGEWVAERHRIWS